MGRKDATWLVLQRDVGDVVQVADLRTVHLGLVLDAASAAALGAHVAETVEAALEGALLAATTAPMDGRPPARPQLVQCPTGLAERVRACAALDADTPVEEAEPRHGAEEVADALVGHLAGRRQPVDLPTPDDWSGLYAQAWRYLERRPWERWGDDVDLRMELTTGAGSADMIGLVLGNAGVQRGLALYPGRRLPASVRAVRTGRSSPAGWPPGTIVLLLDADGVPSDLARKALRYGWSVDAELVPVCIAWDREGPAAPDARAVRTITLALAAILDRDRRGPQVVTGDGPDTRGEAPLSGGRVGRYRLLAVTHGGSPAAGGRPRGAGRRPRSG